MSLHTQPLHSCERLIEAESKIIEELEQLSKQVKEKVKECQGEFGRLDQYLSELQEQLEQSRGFIEESFQSFKAILEKRRVLK